MTAPMVDYKIHWLKMMSVPESRAVVGRHDGINGRDSTVGVMTLAVMTRATLGHTGHALTAGIGTTGVYLLVIASIIVRLLGGVLPDWAWSLYTVSAILWCSAFAGFLVLYGSLLTRPPAES